MISLLLLFVYVVKGEIGDDCSWCKETYADDLACLNKLSRGYTLVRAVGPDKVGWFDNTDSLEGTDAARDETGPDQYNAIFNDKVPGFNQFLFTSGDCSTWLFTSKEAAIGEKYSNEPRKVCSSSDNVDDVTTPRWYNRDTKVEDPWISVSDHHDAIPSGKIVYGESNWGSGGQNHYATTIPVKNGALVFIRKSDLDDDGCDPVPADDKPEIEGVHLILAGNQQNTAQSPDMCVEDSRTTGIEDGSFEEIGLQCCFEKDGVVTSERDLNAAGEDVDCVQGLNYDDSTNECDNRGGRLCTAEEIRSNSIKGAKTGCGHAYRHVWTSSDCDSTHMVSVGNRVNSQRKPDMCLHDDSIYGIKNRYSALALQCCFETTDGDGNVKVSGERDQDANGVKAACMQGITYNEAVGECGNRGGRLCTVDEVISGVGAETGCRHDYRHVWTSDRCVEPKDLCAEIDIDQYLTSCSGEFASVDDKISVISESVDGMGDELEQLENRIILAQKTNANQRKRLDDIEELNSKQTATNKRQAERLAGIETRLSETAERLAANGDAVLPKFDPNTEKRRGDSDSFNNYYSYILLFSLFINILLVITTCSIYYKFIQKQNQYNKVQSYVDSNSENIAFNT